MQPLVWGHLSLIYKNSKRVQNTTNIHARQPNWPNQPHINVSICFTSLIHNFAKSFFGQYFTDTALSGASPPLSRMLDLVNIQYYYSRARDFNEKNLEFICSNTACLYIHLYLFLVSKFNNIILMEPVL